MSSKNKMDPDKRAAFVEKLAQHGLANLRKAQQENQQALQSPPSKKAPCKGAIT